MIWHNDEENVKKGTPLLPEIESCGKVLESSRIDDFFDNIIAQVIIDVNT